MASDEATPIHAPARSLSRAGVGPCRHPPREGSEHGRSDHGTSDPRRRRSALGPAAVRQAARGRPANFTYQCRSLGADARLVTRVGDDRPGPRGPGAIPAPGPPDRARPGRPRVADGDGRRRPWPPTASPDSRSASTSPGTGSRPTRRRSPAAAGADAVCFGSLAQRGEPSRRRDPLARRGRPPRGLAHLRREPPPAVRRPRRHRRLAGRWPNALKLNDQELPALAAMFGLPGGRAGGDGGAGRPLRALAGGPDAGAGGSLLLADGALVRPSGSARRGERHHRGGRRLHGGPGRRPPRRPAARRDQPPRQRGRGVRLLPARRHAGLARCVETPLGTTSEVRP